MNNYEESLENYKIVSNSIQLQNVKLRDVSVVSNGEISEELNVRLNFKRGIESLGASDKENNEVLVILKTIFEETSGKFSVSFTYEGLVEAKDEELESEILEKYAYQQVVPLLLPYARMTLNFLLTQMHLPHFEIPTIDVMRSREENGD